MPGNAHDDDLDLRLKALLSHAYDERVDVETAARHLWAMHHPDAIQADAEPVEVATSAAGDDHATAPPRSSTPPRMLAGAFAAVLLVASLTTAVLFGGSLLPGEGVQSVAQNTRQVLAVEAELGSGLLRDGAGEPASLPSPPVTAVTDASTDEQEPSSATSRGLADLITRLPGR